MKVISLTYRKKRTGRKDQGRLITVPLVPYFGSPGTQESKCIKFFVAENYGHIMAWTKVAISIR